MCSATDGASPVNRCTLAASAIFSSTVRGVPGRAEHLEPGAGVAEGPRRDLDRLALEPAAMSLEGGHLIVRRRLGRCAVVCSVLPRPAGPRGGRSPRGRGSPRRGVPVEVLEELGHLRLPAGVDLGARPSRPGRRARSWRSRSSRSAGRRCAGTASSCASPVSCSAEHVRPDRGVAPAVLRQQLRLDGGSEANPHVVLLLGRFGSGGGSGDGNQFVRLRCHLLIIVRL